MKNVQIPEELFTRLYSYFFLDKNDHLQEQIIKDMLSDKMERIQRREQYHRSGHAPANCNQGDSAY